MSAATKKKQDVLEPVIMAALKRGRLIRASVCGRVLRMANSECYRCRQWRDKRFFVPL